MKNDNEINEVKIDLLIDQQENEQKTNEYFDHMMCKEGKPCIHICCSEHCQSQAIVCSDMNCSCHSQHDVDKLCESKKISAVVKKLESKKQDFPDLLKWINKKYDELIDWISQQREKIYKRTKFAGLTEAQMNFLSAIDTGKCEDLTGKKVHEVVKNFHSEKKKIEQTSKLIQNFVQKHWKYCVDIIRLQISEINQLIADACLYEFDFKDFDSKVVSNEFELAILTDFLNVDKRKVLKYELLYRASENDFKVSQFWEKCNHKADTVTLIHTEYDKVIGGYTPLSWKMEKGNGSPESDPSLQSFLFSVTDRTKFTLKKLMKQRAINHYTDCGPIFGGGADLCIYEDANKYPSFANIGSCYENKKEQQKMKQGLQFFTGSTSKKFKIKEWEVWQVTFDESINGNETSDSQFTHR